MRIGGSMEGFYSEAIPNLASDLASYEKLLVKKNGVMSTAVER